MSNVCPWVRMLIGTAAIGCGANVLAQTPAPAAGVLGEIVVTAEKRESTVQQTPISISAFSGDELSSTGITGSDVLANYTPGLTIQKEVIGKVVIRGVGTENYTVGSDPGVAIHKDGFYIARSSVSIFDFYDVNRVEVLRGPQGTLYGRNASGGVINIVSNEPSAEFGGYARAEFGNYAKRRVEAAIGGGLGDNVQARLSVLYAQRDGYSKNIFPGLAAIPSNPATGYPGVAAISSAKARGVDELDNQDLWGARAQLRVGLGDTANVLFAAELSRDDSLPPAFKYFDTSSAYWFNAFGPDQALPDLRTVSQDFSKQIPGTGRSVPSVGRANQDSFTATVNWDVGDLKFRSLSGYRKIDFSWINDGDGFDQFFVNYFQTDESKQFTQEFQLSSTGAGPLQWIAGLYYLDEKAKTFTGIPFLFIIPVPSPALLWDGESNTKAYAVFGQATYAWSDRLRTTLGLRYNKEKKQGFLDFNAFGGVVPRQRLSKDWNAVTPKLGIDYDFTPDVMGYFSVTRGFKSGGFNLLAVQEPYNPEYLWAYEAGVKTKSAGGRLIFNAGVFYYDYKDLQVGKVVRTSAVVTNAAQATIKGGEIELRALPIDNLEFNAGVAFLDTKYDAFITEDPGWPGARGCGTLVTAPNEISLAGCELARSPKVQGSLGAQLRFPLANSSEFRIRADLSYRGKQFFTQFNREQVSQDGYALLNARLTYAGPEDRWSVTAYGDNLSDKEYFATVLESGVAAGGTVVPQAVLGAPRTYGVVLNYRF